MTTTRASAGKAAILACVALTACSSSGTTSSTASPGSEWPPPLAGVHWRLRTAEGPAGSATFPGTIDGWLEATTTGAITGSDGCAFFSAVSRTRADRLRLSRIDESANGCVDESGPLLAMRTAVDHALLSRHPTRIRLTPNRLLVRGSGYVLTYANGGPATHASQLTGEPSTTSGTT